MKSESVQVRHIKREYIERENFRFCVFVILVGLICVVPAGLAAIFFGGFIFGSVANTIIPEFNYGVGAIAFSVAWSLSFIYMMSDYMKDNDTFYTTRTEIEHEIVEKK